MTDLEIIEQLLHGNHLEPIELKRARELVHSLNVSLNGRL